MISLGAFFLLEMLYGVLIQIFTSKLGLASSNVPLYSNTNPSDNPILFDIVALIEVAIIVFLFRLNRKMNKDKTYRFILSFLLSVIGLILFTAFIISLMYSKISFL